MSMTKSQTISALAEKSGLTKAQVDTLLCNLVELAGKEAVNGFVIPGFGKLTLVQRAARTARNPKTGEPVQVPAKKAVKFRIVKAFAQDIISR